MLTYRYAFCIEVLYFILIFCLVGKVHANEQEVLFARPDLYSAEIKCMINPHAKPLSQAYTLPKSCLVGKTWFHFWPQTNQWINREKRSVPIIGSWMKGFGSGSYLFLGASQSRKQLAWKCANQLRNTILLHNCFSIWKECKEKADKERERRKFTLQKHGNLNAYPSIS